MNDISDKQSGELEVNKQIEPGKLKEQMRTQIRYAEMMEVHGISAPYVNRFYLTPTKDGMIRMTFSEDVPDVNESKTRAAVVLTLQGYINFVAMAQQHIQGIQKSQAAMLAQKTDKDVLQ